MPLYRRVRNEVTGDHYDKPVTSPLRKEESELKQPLSDHVRPPKFRTDKAGRPAARQSTATAAGTTTAADEPANTEKE